MKSVGELNSGTVTVSSMSNCFCIQTIYINNPYIKFVSRCNINMLKSFMTNGTKLARLMSTVNPI